MVINYLDRKCPYIAMSTIYFIEIHEEKWIILDVLIIVGLKGFDENMHVKVIDGGR